MSHVKEILFVEPETRVLDVVDLGEGSSMRILNVKLPGLHDQKVVIHQGVKFIGNETDVAALEVLQLYPNARLTMWTETERQLSYLGLNTGKPIAMFELLNAISFGPVAKRPGAGSPGEAEAAKGNFGVVFPVCVKPAPTPKLHTPCASLTVPLSDGFSVRLTVTIALKLTIMPPLMAADFADESGKITRTHKGKWVGQNNPWRELLIGRFASRLLAAGITPHVPLLYSFSPIVDLPSLIDRRHGGLVVAPNLMTFPNPAPERTPGLATFTEFSDLSLADWLKRLTKVPESHYLRSSAHLWKSTLMQLFQGLLALQMHLGSQHNDAHPGNVMGSSTAEGELFYAIPLDWNGEGPPEMDTPVAYYRVSTYNVLWKWIDFGFSTSKKLFGEDDTRTAFALRPDAFNPHAVRDMTHEASKTASELYDIGRLVGSILRESRASIRERATAVEEGKIPDVPTKGYLPKETTRLLLNIAKLAVELSADSNPELLFLHGIVPSFYKRGLASGPLPPDSLKVHTKHTGRLLRIFHAVFAEERMSSHPPVGSIVYDLRRRDNAPLNDLEKRVIEFGEL